MRLIDADAQIDEIGKINPVDYGSMFSYEAHSAAREVLRDVVRILDTAPTIDLNILLDGKAFMSSPIGDLPINSGGMRTAVDEIARLQPKHGEWIKKKDEVCYWRECSVCGNKPPLDQYKQEWLSQYCPSCNAEMHPTSAEEGE